MTLGVEETEAFRFSATKSTAKKKKEKETSVVGYVVELSMV